MAAPTESALLRGGDRRRGNLERFARELVVIPTKAGAEQEEQCTK